MESRKTQHKASIEQQEYGNYIYKYTKLKYFPNTRKGDYMIPEIKCFSIYINT